MKMNVDGPGHYVQSRGVDIFFRTAECARWLHRDYDTALNTNIKGRSNTIRNHETTENS
jgi:hypothetical protein